MNLFGENSSIHGVKYVFTQSQLRSTRIFWCLALLLSLSGFFYNINNAFRKWMHEPQIVMKSTEKSSTDFPLPAVTICSNLFARDNRANFFDIFTDYLKELPQNLTDSQCKYFAANLHWCQPNFGLMVETVCPKSDVTGINALEIINKSALEVHEAFYICLDGRCENSIFRYFTDFGICYSTNMLGSRAIYDYNTIHDDFKIPLAPPEYDNEVPWTPERGYVLENATIPHRAERGSDMSFTPVLNQTDSENICALRNFRIYFHKPNEIVTPTHESVFVNYEDYMEFHIVPMSHRTDIVLKGFPPDTRKCYFDGEKKLRFFTAYTKALCEWECKANLTLEKCGCVKFSMPRDKYTKVCNVSTLRCMGEVPNLSCNCYVPCIDIKYNYRMDRTTFNRRLYAAGLPKTSTMSWISITMETGVVEEIENFVSYKWSNFVSDFGGLLGLFMGCSLLSIIEIFYFVIYGFGNRVAKPNNVTPDVEKSDGKWAVKREVPKGQMNDLDLQNERHAVIFGAINDLQRSLYETNGKNSNNQKMVTLKGK